MNKHDLEILIELRKNSRTSLKKISKNLKMPISTVFERLKRLEKKYIKGYKTLIGFEETGFPIKVMLAVKVNNKQKKEFVNFVSNCLNLNSFFKISNSKNYLIYVVFSNMLEYYEFRQQIKEFGIQNETIYHIINEIKNEEFLTKNSDSKLILKELGSKV